MRAFMTNLTSMVWVDFSLVIEEIIICEPNHHLTDEMVLSWWSEIDLTPPRKWSEIDLTPPFSAFYAKKLSK